MKLTSLARFGALIQVLVLVLGLAALPAPLAVESSWETRQTWLAQNGWLWQAGGWVALAGIFGWMAFLVALMHIYSPAHRVVTMLQSGLMLLAAGLLIAGVTVWMALLPTAADGEWAGFIDRLALAFLGGGLFMADATTGWIGLDLALLKKLAWGWTLPGILVALCWVPAPFVLPAALLPLTGLVLFLLWVAFWGTRPSLPPVYQELTGDLLRAIKRE